MLCSDSSAEFTLLVVSPPVDGNFSIGSILIYTPPVVYFQGFFLVCNLLDVYVQLKNLHELRLFTSTNKELSHNMSSGPLPTPIIIGRVSIPTFAFIVTHEPNKFQK